ncbi:MAG: hypothetical protein GXO76_00215 [Calditrichaeota bacterium]|nr:hypothetical protein [Calditrichota bacterium]
MNRRLSRLFLFLLIAELALPLRGAPRDGSRLFLCDQASRKVLLVSTRSNWNDSTAILWEWSAYETDAIPASQKHLFDYLSDARLVDNGKKVIVAGGSGGGVAIIRLLDKKVLFFTRAGKSPHSATLLPDGSLAVVSSQDNRLRVYFPASEFSHSVDVTLPSPHGLVWDTHRNGLWVVGRDSLYFFTYKKKPVVSFSRKVAFALPSSHGHDLFPRAKRKTLFVTTQTGVYEFFPKSGRFRPFAPLKDVPNVKSVCENPKTGRIVFVRAVTKWWNDTVNFWRPRGQKTRKGARFYKARWSTVFRF